MTEDDFKEFDTHVERLAQAAWDAANNGADAAREAVKREAEAIKTEWGQRAALPPGFVQRDYPMWKDGVVVNSPEHEAELAKASWQQQSPQKADDKDNRGRDASGLGVTNKGAGTDPDHSAFETALDNSPKMPVEQDRSPPKTNPPNPQPFNPAVSGIEHKDEPEHKD